MAEQTVSASQQFSRSSHLAVIAAVLAILAIQIGLLHALGRDWTCACGSIRLWQGELDPDQNSQQFSDPYSLLHMIFGFGIYVWLHRIRPHWSLARRALTALISSAIWEMTENLPLIVDQFGGKGTQLHYFGDSILNSLGDTLFMMAAFMLASRLSTIAVTALAALLEAGVYLLIGDGLIASTFRLLGYG